MTEQSGATVEQATYLDEGTSTRHTAEFFGADDTKMFGCRHSPLDNLRGGVVICSSIQSEFVKNVRRETLLGRALAAKGLGVQRFHYRGTGNSFGDESSITFDTLCDDALAAAAYLKKDVGVDRIAFVGTRLGALVAAAAAARFDSAPLVLWDPVTDATRYFRELLRFLQMQRLVDDAGAPDSESPDEQLKLKGRLDLFGYAVPAPLYESLQGRTLISEIGSRPQASLLVQFGDEGNLRGEYARFVDHLTKSGSSIDTRLLLKRQAWWFSVGWEPDDPASDELMATTCNWINERLNPGVEDGHTPAHASH